MSPMDTEITLTPGEPYTGSFKIYINNTVENTLNYQVYLQPYYRDEDNHVIFENIDGHSDIQNWTTIDSPTSGLLTPGGFTTINYTINPPLDLPAGEQYMTITVGTAPNDSTNTDENGILINETIAIGYTVYAKTAGTTRQAGDITDLSVPSVVISNPITLSSTVTNTGNVHEKATYITKISSFFSGEIYYDNTDSPETHIIFPDRTFTNETTWDRTPQLGVFNITYSVDYLGDTKEIDQVVIVFPFWFFIIAAVILASIIGYIILRIRKNHAKARDFTV